MPETDNQHPRRTIAEDGFAPNPRADYVELGITTCFSFLRGASDAVDFATTANALGYDKLGCFFDKIFVTQSVRLVLANNNAMIASLHFPIFSEIDRF